MCCKFSGLKNFFWVASSLVRVGGSRGGGGGSGPIGKPPPRGLEREGQGLSGGHHLVSQPSGLRTDEHRCCMPLIIVINVFNTVAGYTPPPRQVQGLDRNRQRQQQQQQPTPRAWVPSASHPMCHVSSNSNHRLQRFCNRHLPPPKPLSQPLPTRRNKRLRTFPVANKEIPKVRGFLGHHRRISFQKRGGGGGVHRPGPASSLPPPPWGGGEGGLDAGPGSSGDRRSGPPAPSCARPWPLKRRTCRTHARISAGPTAGGCPPGPVPRRRVMGRAAVCRITDVPPFR